MAETTEKKSGKIVLDLETFKTCGAMGLKFSPLAIGYLIAESLVLKGGDVCDQTLLLLTGAGVLVTIAWLIFDAAIGKRDFLSFIDSQRVIDPIEKDSQSEIHEGLQMLKFLDDSAVMDPTSSLSPEDAVMFRSINDIAIQALTPATYHNYHGKELTQFGEKQGEKPYIDSKKKAVLRAFSIAPAGYKQFVIGQLPVNVTFEEHVDKYVHSWVHEVVIPAILRSSKKLIDYYDGQMSSRWHSRAYRKLLKERKMEQEMYKSQLGKLADSIILSKNKGTQS